MSFSNASILNYSLAGGLVCTKMLPVAFEILIIFREIYPEPLLPIKTPPIRRLSGPGRIASCNNHGQVVHTRVPLSPSSTIWYRPKGSDHALWLRREKITVGPASHWPCFTDSVVYPSTGSVAWEREMSTRIRSTAVLRYLYLYLYRLVV